MYHITLDLFLRIINGEKTISQENLSFVVHLIENCEHSRGSWSTAEWQSDVKRSSGVTFSACISIFI